ncbi:MAG: hypothetical protein AAGC55_30775, partial [Myxococcota bacterium]
MPLLQHTLQRLWEKHEGRQLTIKAYLEMGRLSGALEQYAEEFFGAFTPTEQEACRRILLRLITPGDRVGQTKRRSPPSEVACDETARKVVAKLVDARLLTTHENLSSTCSNFVEISHEALISGWSRLKGWLDKSRDILILGHRLTEATNQWHTKRDATTCPRIPADDDLWRGTNLKRALDSWQRGLLDPNRHEIAFLEASRAAASRSMWLKYALSLTIPAIIVAALVSIIVLNARERQMRQVAQMLQESGISELTRKNPLIAALYLSGAHKLGAYGSTLFIPLSEAMADVKRSLVAHRNRLVFTSYSPQGELIITVSSDSTAILWDAETREPLHILDAHHRELWSASFNPRGSQVVTGSSDHTAIVWDTRTGQAVYRLDGHQGRVTWVAYSPDGRYIATASDDGSCRLWN